MPDSDIEHRATQDANHLFSSAGAAIQGLRLRVDKKVVVSIEDLYAGFQEARRKYEDRKYREAYDKYDQVYNQFADKIGQWERKAESHLQAVKDSHKPGKLEQLKTEIADVKTQSRSAFRLLSRLRSTLEPLSKLEDATETTPAVARAPEKRKPVRRARVVDESLLEFSEDDAVPAKGGAEAVPPPQAARQGFAPAPLGFLEDLKAADPEQRLAVVEQYFDFESELGMEVVQTAERRMSVTFDPALEPGRFCYLLDAGRVIRIDGVGKVLDIYDPEQDQNQALSLKDFVRQIQGGAWLLWPRRA